MKLPWNKPHRHELVAVCSLGSSRVSVGVVSLKRNSQPELIYARHLPLTPGVKFEAEDFARQMRMYLDRLLERLRTDLPGLSKKYDAPSKINAVQCVFATPWFTTSIHTAYEEFDEPQIITQRLIDVVVENAIDSFYSEAESVFHSGRFDSEATVVEYEQTATTLNGYPTKDPFHKETSEFTARLFFSAVPTQTIDHVENALEQHVSVERVQHHTQPYLEQEVLGSFATPQMRMAILDIGGDRTDISVATNGHLQHVYSVEQGVNDLIRRIATKQSLGYEAAQSRVASYLANDLNNKQHERTETTITEVLTEWWEGVRDYLNEIHKTGFWPNRIYIVGPDDAASVFSKMLFDKMAGWCQEGDLPTPRCFTIDAEYMRPFIYIPEGVQPDPVLILAGLYIARERGYAVVPSSHNG